MLRRILAVAGILLSAGYILWALQRVLFGPRNPRWAALPDTTNWWEQVTMAAFVAVIIAVGVYPATLVDVIKSATPSLLGLG